ncbi:hypothetical protein VPNG_04430 [Cytospora leucostoma]|uniref:Uncharacterized protein n=1 Tax=Cytospora leucostoma TaxID=1230097 RepID=A0A423XBT5_9PEZI|nr:hypothetical protein VPNG_04430 [Cytospora leucostoma]
MQLTASLLFALLNTSVLALPQDVKEALPRTSTVTAKPVIVTATTTSMTTITTTSICVVTLSQPAKQPVPPA